MRRSPYYHSLQRITEPTIEAVSLREMKDHLRLLPDVADDDGYICDLIAAARRVVESRTSITLAATQWRCRLSLDACACDCGGYELPMPPLLLGDNYPIEITYQATDRTLQVVPTTAYSVDDGCYPARLYTHSGWPNACCQRPVTISYWAGCEHAAQVPAELRQAVRMLAAHWYENREAVVTDGGAQILPMAVDSLLASASWTGRF